MPPIIIQLTLIQVRSRQIFDCMLIIKVTIKESEFKKIKKKRKEKNGDIHAHFLGKCKMPINSMIHDHDHDRRCMIVLAKVKKANKKFELKLPFFIH